ncbi:MAG TPA: ATP-binding protein [Candidatus Desulfobacillus sp.]|nr:ATP-binding protein [Candidatus Desulfobacillus sp.]
MTGAISPLKRHILARLLLAAGILSALLLIVFLTAYRSQLVAERSRASMGFNLLLQAALENAMLKRDVPGLAEIVGRLGTQPGIHGVMILNPQGDVRFASSPEKIGRKLPALVPAAGARPSADFHVAEDGVEVLRSVNPVRNQPPCKLCHGDAAAHPVNGILVVDYDAAEIRASAWKSALAFAGAGIAVLALIMAVLWRSLSKQVLAPVAALGRASAALEAGRLDERVRLEGDDELAALGRSFNRMAERLEDQLARLRAHESYLQDVLDGLPDGIRVIRASDMHVVLANRAFCQQVGRDAEAVAGRPCHASTHDAAAPCVPTLVVCPVHELKQVGDTLKATHHHRRPDGSQFPAEIHAVLTELDGGGGRERYVVESVRDLGQAARVSHEQRLSELGLLAAGIAHEIHNPLGSVRLGVQGLKREIAAGRSSPEQIVGYLDLIDQEIDNCIAVTRRLLLLARPPAGSLQLVVANEALTDTLRLLEFDAQTHGIVQRSELPDEPLRLLAEEAEIRMIFLNLMQNAHHAMPTGGTLTAKLSRDGDRACIEIADTGVGMPPETVARIFDPFFSRRADGVAGTGLGLTIVKNFVERMDGSIAVASAPDAGTRFTLRLPLAEAALENGA